MHSFIQALILSYIEHYLVFSPCDAGGARSGALKVAVLHEASIKLTTDYHVTLGPAIDALARGHVYDIEWIPLEDLVVDGGSGDGLDYLKR